MVARVASHSSSMSPISPILTPWCSTTICRAQEETREGWNGDVEGMESEGGRETSHELHRSRGKAREDRRLTDVQ